MNGLKKKRRFVKSLSSFAKSAFFSGSLLVSFCYQEMSFAQRGTNVPSLPQEGTPPSPQTGFPGFFDTETLPQYRFMGELPTFGIDFGITPNLTVGVNALSLLTITSSSSIFYLKSRYRFFSNVSAASAITVYGIYGRFPATKDDPLSDKPYNAFLGFATSNTSFYFQDFLSDAAHVTFSLMAGNLNFGREDLGDLAYINANGSLVAAALSYQTFVNPRLGLHGTILANLYNSISVDSSTGSTALTAKPSLTGSLLFGRMAFDIYLEEAWVLSGYGLVTQDLSITPALGLIYRW